MEKYLRTKDEILTIRTNLNNQVFVVDSKGKWFEPEYIEKDIIKEADTLEELLDCIVVDYGHYKHFMSKPFGCAIENIVKNDYSMKGIKEGTIKVYGAIWCKWGLKYVAKMDDKGELELI